MAVILPQHISTHHFVSFKYLIILLENYTLIKLEKNKVTEPEISNIEKKKALLIWCLSHSE